MPVHAFIFPGQGSQSVGMGRDLAAAFPAAREVFEEVDETLKQKLRAGVFVSGLVYAVATGLIDVVVPPARVEA